ncbi:MAG: GyrI-like domain-containing protein [Sporomusaceae bacterium]|jgi:effector-binding domain-containing protein|nr:GyrI-like domain-containing protein [Sporomusaceae bacterium]
MPRVSNFVIIESNEQPSISIRATACFEELPLVIGGAYDKLAVYLKETGSFLADAPYVAHFNMDITQDLYLMEGLDIEIGYPVTEPLTGTEKIKATFIPKCKSVSCMYRGPYHEMSPTYQEMAAWIENNGYTPVGTVYEYYFNNPENFPDSELLTLITMPLSHQ